MMDNKFNEDQRVIIDEAKRLGFNDEKLNIILNPNFSWEQMEVIKEGIREGIPLDKVQMFAKESLSFEEMQDMKNMICENIGLKKEESILECFTDLYHILKDEGYNQQATALMGVFSDINLLKHHATEQNKILEEGIKLIEQTKDDESTKFVKKSIIKVKENYDTFSDKVDETIKATKLGIQNTVETYKTKGVIEFLKTLKSLIKGVKDGLEEMYSLNNHAYKSIESFKEKAYEAKEEVNVATRHIKNAFKIIRGKEVEKDLPPTSFKDLSKTDKAHNAIKNLLSKAISKLEVLENFFGEKVIANNKKLDDMLITAKEKSKESEEQKSKAKEINEPTIG